MEKKLHKSSTDKAIAGVCGGIAEYFGIDSVIIRLVFVLLALGVGSGVLIYVVCAIVMPDERKAAERAAYTYSENGSYTSAGSGEYNSYTSAASGENGSGFYQDRAANNDYSNYTYYNDTNNNPKPQKRVSTHQGVGIVLIVIAAFILVRYFVPKIPDPIMAAGFLLLIGLYLVLRKK